MTPDNKKADLRQQLLLAAFECTGGDPDATFSSEQLLVAAWNRDPASWGLRGYEREHPDSNRIHRELDSRGKGQAGIVGSGLLERVRPRTYRLTTKGLAMAAAASGEGGPARERVDRVLEAEVTRILEHPAFVAWLKDSSQPKHFREVGHLWGVAPGTPPAVVRSRLKGIEDTLEAADNALDQKGVTELGDRQGRLLYDRSDVERGRAFLRAMRERFAKDLSLLAGGPLD